MNAKIKTAIDHATERLEALRLIGELLSKFPELLAELGIDDGRHGLGPAVLFEEAAKAESERLMSNFERVRSFFLAKQNEWAEAPRIGEALNMSRGTVATVLWTSHRDSFEQAPVAGSIKKKKWRLKPEAYHQHSS